MSGTTKRILPDDPKTAYIVGPRPRGIDPDDVHGDERGDHGVRSGVDSGTDNRRET